MTRRDTLFVLITQARTNGFDFRRWFRSTISPSWTEEGEAIELLDSEGRYFALIFSHDFARALWKKGEQMNFIVPTSTYRRMNCKGEIETIVRKPFTRRTIKADVWKYHLRQMAISDDPLLYLRRFVPQEDESISPQSEIAELTAVD
jgi:hypothetical protein